MYALLALLACGEPTDTAKTTETAEDSPGRDTQETGPTAETDCTDGLDDDGDGYIDCYDKDDCGPETACLGEFSCDDGIDNDGNGVADCADGGCADWPTCYESDCGDGADQDGDGDLDCDDADCAADDACFGLCADEDLGEATGNGVASGSTAGTGDDFPGNTSACGSAGAAEDVAYRWRAPSAGVWVIDTQSSPMDTVLKVYADCDGPEVSCNDESTDETGAFVHGSRVCIEGVDAGDPLLIVVDAWSTPGDYVLDIQPGVACSETTCDDGVDEDTDGSVDCDDSDCWYDAACTEADCDDGLDDDGDGTTDCADYDCWYDAACAELECGNGLDDDGDGTTDCDDYDCWYDSACAEVNCADGVDDEGDGAVDCDDSDCGFDTSCYESDCSNGADDDADGAADCADADCSWYPTCVEADCADGVDNEGDGAADCADLDCIAEPACVESTCDDGVDDDGDGLVDCADTNCLTNAACGDACVSADLGSATGSAVATGDNTGAPDVFLGSCTYGSGGSDVAYTWTAPSDGCYRFGTGSSDHDTVLMLYEDGCSGAELACDDDGGDDDGTGAMLTSALNADLVAGQTVLVVIDGYGPSSLGTWVLDIEPGC